MTSSPYIKIKPVSMCPSCNAKYFFEMPNRPTKSAKKITFHMLRSGKVAHLCDETRAMPASERRGKIVKEVTGGVSNAYLQMQGERPSLELLADNLKVVSAEISRSTRLHRDMIMDLIVTQQIMKESDAGYLFCPG